MRTRNVRRRWNWQVVCSSRIASCVILNSLTLGTFRLARASVGSLAACSPQYLSIESVPGYSDLGSVEVKESNDTQRFLAGPSFSRVAAAECTTCIPPEQAQNIIAEQASRTVAALKTHDMNELAKLVHPVKGVRFSPYAFLDTQADVRFTAVMIRRAFADRKIRAWGTYDGSGKPMRLSFADYYKRFVYDRDFARSPVSYNNQQSARGNTRDNSRGEYPDAIIVEFHFPGAGDSCVLRLIFQQYRGAWYLVHIVHDEWTI
ncbi:hypothetical protein ABIF99_002581 [Bradyrhizobium japonicum]